MKLFFDTETTGKAEFKLDASHRAQPRIVQIGAILADDAQKTVGEINLIVKPDGWTIPKEASDIHGITHDFAMRYGVHHDIVMTLFSRLVEHADVLVAHNFDFDSLVVRSAFTLMDSPQELTQRFAGKPSFCTMKASTNILRLPGMYGFKWPKLQEAHRFFLKRDFDGAHDAMADVRACMAVYHALQKPMEVAS